MSPGEQQDVVVYNGHLSGILSGNKNDYASLNNTNIFVLEAYAGAKLQISKKLELSFSLNARSAEVKMPYRKTPLWGTFGMKILLAEEGEGCYD